MEKEQHGRGVPLAVLLAASLWEIQGIQGVELSDRTLRGNHKRSVFVYCQFSCVLKTRC